MCYHIYCQFGNDKLLQRLVIFCLREAHEKNNKILCSKNFLASLIALLE